mgnify:CR=1 FL=1
MGKKDIDIFWMRVAPCVRSGQQSTSRTGGQYSVKDSKEILMQEEMKVYYRFKIQMPMKVLIAEGTCAVVESKHADTEQTAVLWRRRS